ncbi:MAG: class I SAM-dependent methyltransferase [Candidatus Thermoplasmatota archaeon]
MVLQKISRFFLDKIVVKFDAFKLKKFVDYIFVIVEKIVFKIEDLLSLYLSFYENLVEKEISLAKISSDDKILHIGCGSIPATCILLGKKTDCQMTGIDKNFKSVKQAKKLIENKKLENKIHIQHADGLNFPVESFDVIIVSQGIKPAFEVLKKISLSIKKTSYVIYRTNVSNVGKLTDKDMFIRRFFEIKKVLHQEKNALLVSVLLSTK